MPKTKTSPSSQAIKPLIPIKQLISMSEGILISADQLEIADFSRFRRGVTLVMFVGRSLKVLITKTTGLHVKLVYNISGDDAVVRKYGAAAVVRAMSYTTEITLLDQWQTKHKLGSTRSSWQLPAEAIRQYELPVNVTGALLLTGIRNSDAFITGTTKSILAKEAKARKLTAQC